MNESYNLQKSIKLQAQTDQNTAITLQQAQISANQRGFTNSEGQIKYQWNVLQDAVKSGKQAEIKAAEKAQADAIRPLLKAQGFTLPKDFGGNLAAAELGKNIALATYYKMSADNFAAGGDTANADAASIKFNTLMKDPNFLKSVSNALAPPSLTGTSTSAGLNVSNTTHAITGYTRQTVSLNIDGQMMPVTVNVPQSNGLDTTPFSALGSAGKTAAANKLKALGFNVKSASGSELSVEVTDKVMSWAGKNTDLVKGQNVTLIPTAQGFQFANGVAGNTYGISFNKNGKAGLFTANDKGGWNLIGGEYGFNPHAASGLAYGIGGAKGSIPGMNSLVAAGSSAFNAAGNFHVTRHDLSRGASFAAHAAPGFLNAASAMAGNVPGVMGSLISHFVTPNIPSVTAGARKPMMTQRAGGGFNFTGANGQAISAATYARLTGQQFRNVLQTMANQGDAGAKQVLGYVGNDVGYDPTKIGQGNNAQMYNAMTWGAHAAAPLSAPPTSATVPSGFKLGK
jgi:hypothetical protein